MSEENQVAEQALTTVISKEIIGAQFNKELTALKYQEALTRLNELEVTEDTLPDTQAHIKKARGFLKKFEEIKTTGKAESLRIGRLWDTVFNELKLPFETAIDDKENKVNEVAKKIAEENRKKENERLRVEGIKTAIDTFIFDQTRLIADAKTDTTLIGVEKMIGSHKANNSRYQELLPTLIERCSELLPLIKKQKENIRELEDLKIKEAAAIASGDDAKVLEIQEAKEVVTYAIDEAKVVVQETAINSAMNSPSAPIEVETISFTPRARRTSWEYEIVDEKKAYAAGMLSCEINDEKAKSALAVVKQTIPKGQTEMIVNGIKYFEKKIY